MNEPTTVRAAIASDLAAINEVYNDAILTSTATWDEVPWTATQREEWFAEHDAATPVLVAEVGGRFAGFAYLSFYRPKSGYRFTREDTIYLHRDFRGRGVGRVLLAELVAAARRLGVHCVIAVIAGDNEASFALHRALGFELAGTKSQCGYKFGTWQDCSEMVLLLDS